MGSIDADLGSPDLGSGRDAGPASSTPAYYGYPEQGLCLGLSYRTDYRAEEERGTHDAVQRLTGGPFEPRIREDRLDRIAFDADQTTLVVSIAGPVPAVVDPEDLFAEPVRWDQRDTPWAGHRHRDLHRWHADFTRLATYTRGSYRVRDHATVAQLREQARGLGIAPLPRRRDDLIAAIQSSPGVPAPAHPDCWPGWFHNGSTLVLRAGTGLSRAIMGRLADAHGAGTLGLAAGGGPFWTGLILFDTADETAELRELRAQQQAWSHHHDARIAEISARLTAAGLSVYHLGGTKPVEGRLEDHIRSGNLDAPVQYFLNGYRGRDSVAGWYSPEDLLALAG